MGIKCIISKVHPFMQSFLDRLYPLVDLSLSRFDYPWDSASVFLAFKYSLTWVCIKSRLTILS